MSVSTFAAAASRRDQQWAVIVRVEGLGTYAGQYAFCSQVPTYAAGSALYVDNLVRFPDPLSERSPIIGGIPDAGSTTVEILDDNLNTITAALRIDRPPQTRISSAMTAAQTTITFESSTGIVASSTVVFVGNEAILVGTLSAGTTFNCTRSALDTDARSHAANSNVYLSLPYLQTRRMRLFYAPADGTAASTEQEFASYRIDGIAMGSSLNSYALSGTTLLKFLSRQINSALPGLVKITGVENDGRLLLGTPISVGPGNASTLFSQLSTWPNEDAYLLVSDEVVSADPTGSGAPYLIDRGVASTPVHEIEPGETYQQVLVAIDGGGSFRYSPGPSPSEDRSSGTWTGTAQWVDIILSMMTSSAHADDGLELVNHRGADTSLSDAARSNWSSLPVGFGIGVPATLIDVPSFVAVRSRTLGMNFPALWTGDKTEPFGEWVNKNFLEPIGAFFATTSGRISLIYPRLPLAGETTTSVGVDDFVGDITAEFASDLLSGSITYKIRSPIGGSDISNTYRASDFTSLFGQRGLYSFDDNPITIEVPGVAADQAGLSAFLQEIAIRRLYRFSRPVWRLKYTTDFAPFATDVGSLVDVTHPDLPDLVNGTRGWTGVICQVMTREARIDDERGAVIDWTVVGYGPGIEAGRVAPSAVVTAVDGDTATVETNRYSSPDLTGLDIPTSDATGFAVDDIVELKDLDGTDAGGGTETVLGVTGDDIELSGDFSGNLAAGLVLVFAGYSDSTATQQGRFVYFGDSSNDIEDTGDPAWRYGEG